MPDTIVVKIGGSTLGAHDTTLEDVVALQRRGLRPVVVHGGGALISEWLKLHGVPTRFERGLRVTDERTLEVVVAVLAGLVNKQLVAALTAAGGNAVGLSGADGGLLKARQLDEKLGFVGEVAEVAFLAENRGASASTGTATFNVTPNTAGAYFNKIACFCFTEQTLAAGQSLDMPVQFFVDPAIAEDPELDHLDTITLSYTFFPAANPAPKPLAAAAPAETRNPL